jgi:aldose 1-epimerase
MRSDIILCHGPLELGISPALGGCCTYLRRRSTASGAWVDVLRPMPVDCRDPFEAACFAMLPYSNRLFDGRLRRPGESDLILPPNCDRIALPVHGTGWMSVWDIDSQDANHVSLHYRHFANEHWPFDMDCTQRVVLAADAVHFEASIRNVGADPMPSGLGFHPRFALHPETLVTLGAQTVWAQDARGYPTHLEPVNGFPRYDYRLPRPADAVDLNHCFADWSGEATLDTPRDKVSVRVSASALLRHLVVYRLPGKSWLCIEPVSHATGALSLDTLASSVHGVHRLEPGQSLAASMEIRF